MGGVLVMGRRTFESIGRPLPGRRTIVVTRQADWSSTGVERADSPDAAIALAGDAATFVVGGAQIYAAMMPRVGVIDLTVVQSQVAGDTRLNLDLSHFRRVRQSRVPAGPRDSVPTRFERWVRLDLIAPKSEKAARTP